MDLDNRGDLLDACFYFLNGFGGRLFGPKVISGFKFGVLCDVFHFEAPRLMPCLEEVIIFHLAEAWLFLKEIMASG